MKLLSELVDFALAPKLCKCRVLFGCFTVEWHHSNRRSQRRHNHNSRVSQFLYLDDNELIGTVPDMFDKLVRFEGSAIVQELLHQNSSSIAGLLGRFGYVEGTRFASRALTRPCRDSLLGQQRLWWDYPRRVRQHAQSSHHVSLQELSGSIPTTIGT